MARSASTLRVLKHGLSSLSTLGRKRRFVAGTGSSSKERNYRRRFFGFVVRLDVCKIESERRRSFKKNEPQAIGRTKGLTQLATKVYAIVAGPTTPVALKLTPRNVSDAPVGREIFRNLNTKRLKSKSVLMDRAYEGD